MELRKAEEMAFKIKEWVRAENLKMKADLLQK